jgi:pimeloyl-ACP methyl ester carboxylesterase
MKWLTKIGQVSFRILSILIILVAISATVHQILSAIEKARYRDFGETVQVNGAGVRLYETGDGNRTIVMLSGFGTRSPIIDFMPLAERLGEEYRMVILEYPGYGFSDDVKTPRSNENIIVEVRTALSEAGFSPPYVLMPHSISGIYAFYYAVTFPEEVEAIVGIDPSMPNQTKPYRDTYEGTPNTKVLENQVLDFLGVHRWMGLTPFYDPAAGMQHSGSYSQEQLGLIRMFYAQRAVSHALASESNLLVSNSQPLYDVKYPPDLAVLTFLSSETVQISQDTADRNPSYQAWDALHEEAITNNAIQQIVILEGPHYLHWTKAEEITRNTKEFFNGLPNSE